MARTAITVTDTSRAGVAQPAQQNSDSSENMALAWNDGKIVLELSATSSTTTFTFPIPVKVDGQAVTSLAVEVTTATPKLVGPFPPGIYNQADGTVLMNPSSGNGRIRAYHLP